MSGLVCERVVVTRNSNLILDGVDLAVPRATFTVLVGPSGAGKTTLLRTIAGLEPLVSGNVRLADRDLAKVSPHQRRIAKVFQEPRLFPNLDVTENVAFGLRVSGVGHRERRATAKRLLGEVGLEGIGGESPVHLSGGEQQRVALARALAIEPELILLDEPLASVDPELRRDLRGLISDLLRSRGITTLYVTHDRDEAAELGDQVALMMNGRVIQNARPQALFERPVSLAAARFFGNPNVLTGTVIGGELALDGAAIEVPGPDGVAVFVIRPERIRFDERSPLRLRVEEGSYLGARVRFRLSGSGITLEAEVLADDAPAVGSEAGVVLPTSHLWRVPHPADLVDDAVVG